jgi:hypothetical protein
MKIPKHIFGPPTLDMKLRRLSKRILERAQINNKTFRKTGESWLVFYYPDKSLQIALSQGIPQQLNISII